MKILQNIILFVVLNIILYLFCVFVAFDWNPMSWVLFSTAAGRVVFIGLEILIISQIEKISET